MIRAEQIWDISIHALREEGDLWTAGTMETTTPFLSTPSARRATRKRQKALPKNGFLSTPSARRATKGCSVRRVDAGDFYPRPPRGGRRGARNTGPLRVDISIHALREEGDLDAHAKRRSDSISIHALREEGDPASGIHPGGADDFYPRPPRGGRLIRSGLPPSL